MAHGILITALGESLVNMVTCKQTKWVRVYHFLADMQGRRWPFLLMAFVALCLVVASLFIQYALHVGPCEYDVYNRFAIVGLMTAGMVLVINPRHLVVILTGYILWASSAIYGFVNSLAMLDLYHQHDNFAILFSSLRQAPRFPFGLPLHAWFPHYFRPSGSCGTYDLMILGLNTGQCMVLVFAAFMLAFLISAAFRFFFQKQLSIGFEK